MDIKIAIDRKGFRVLFEKFILEKLDKNNKIEILIEDAEDIEPTAKKTFLVKDSAIFKIQVTERFIVDHYLKNTEDYQNLRIELDELFAFLAPKTDMILKQVDFFSALSIVFQYEEYKLHFPFNFKSEKYSDAFTSVLKLISNIISDKNEKFKNDLKKAFDEGYEARVFEYKNENWEVIDPLEVISADINAKYRKDKDVRITKPHIVVNRENIWKYFIFDQNWVLVFDKLETMLIQPNDVAIYSNISERNLAQAEVFYEKYILPRHKIYHGLFPSERIQKEYFDYFELIIQAVIFSYTSLEAFANICIPDRYKYVTKKDGIKTVYSKEAIERKFSLREKFKIILQEILDSPDVSKTDWWNAFINLENLRNEIIHSKPSKSETRYSKLLEKEIFNLIRINKRIIEYYGNLISQNKKSLLNDFPYDFGYDQVWPGLMSDKNYDDAYRSMNNIKM